MFLIAFLYFLFASTFIIGKFILQYSTPLFIIATRMLISGSIILLYLFTKNKKLTFSKKHIFYLVQLVVLHIYIPYLFEFWSLQYITAAKVCLLYSLSPFISALFSFIFFKEIMTKMKFLALFIGFGGFLPVLISSAPSENMAIGSIGFFSFPEIVMLIAVLSAAYAWVLFRKMMNEFGYSALFLNGIAMFFSGVLALVAYFILDGRVSPVTSIWPFMLCLSFLVIIGNIICYNLYGYLLKKYTATFLAFTGFIAPIFADILGRIFLKESVGSGFYITMVMVSIGIYIFYKEELRQNYIK
jgi:drug/metabolite transporter (DMT)-like permease